MTIQAGNRRAGPYTGNGAQTAFVFEFKVFEDEDVTVVTLLDGVETTEVSGSDYTVTLNSDQDNNPGGTVSFVVAPAASAAVVITSAMEISQPAVFTNQGGFYPRVLNDSLDRQAIATQQLDEKLDRAILAPVSQEGFTVSPTANTVFGTDANGEFSQFARVDLQGDPGGNIMAVGLFTALSIMTVDAGTDIIQTAGHHTPGKGVARYKRWSAPMTALPAWGENVWWVTLIDGSKWMLAEGRPTSDMFGTYGDAVRAYLSDTVTGTDVTAIINKLTYYAESEWGNGIAVLSRGGHRTSDTIHVGMGTSFRSVHLIGEVEHPWATRHDNQTAFPSAEIKAERNDRPAVNVQGARSSSVTHVSVEGPLYARAINLGLGRSDGGETMDDTDAADWLPGTALHTNGQYNPGAGIAIDAFSGVAPVGAYPAVAYPFATTQYGKNYSSEVTLEGCKIAGFSVGVVVQPCDADGNGDFVRMRGCSTTECVYGVSIGNGQSRNVEISNHNYIHLHTFIVNGKHGKQRGKLGGPIINLSGGQSVQLFDLNMGFAGLVEFITHYSEGLWRFGNAVGKGNIHHNGEITMTAATGDGMFPLRGVPANILGTTAFPTVGGSTDTAVVLSGTLAVPSVGVISTSQLETRALRVICVQRDGSGPISAAHAQLNNALCGGIFVASSLFARRVVRLGTSHTIFNTVTGAVIGAGIWDGKTWGASRRIHGCPIEAKELTAVQSPYSPVPIPAEPSTYGETSLTSKTLTGTTFTFTVAGIGADAERRHAQVGDVLWHDASDSLFVITARATNNITATLLNNHLNTGGVITHPGGAINLATGSYHFFSGRYYIPDYPVFGTFTAASPTITDVGTGENVFGTDADFVNGDYVAVNALEEHVIGVGRTVSSRDVGARTITMSANADKSQADRRLIFARTP